jgi:acetyltransferase
MGPRLNFLFAPKSIAVVGASKDPQKLGYVLLNNLLKEGYQGELYPVNPGGGEILSKKVYKSLTELEGKVELVLISIPNKSVPGILEESASIGAKGAVILSSGFGEMPGEGIQLQGAINQICKRSKIRIVGPNCMGIYSRPSNLNATYFWEIPGKAGNISFISQSGAYGGILFSEIRKRGIGIANFISIGNQADLTHSDFIEHLLHDEYTKVIALFIEEIRDGARLMKVAKEAALYKPVVAFKVGRTPAGIRAALSHTGSMAGTIEVYKGAMKQAGVLLAQDSTHFFDLLTLFSAYPDLLPPRDGVGILTISGGPCVAASDACEEEGLSVPILSQSTRSRIRSLIPTFGADSNPVDMTPQMNPDNFVECVDLVCAEDSLGSIIAINVGLDRPSFADAFIKALQRYGKPVVSFVVDVPTISSRFSEAGIPTFQTPESAVRACAGLLARKEWLKRPKGTEVTYPSKPSKLIQRLLKKGITQLDEHTSKRVLKEYGIRGSREGIAKDYRQAAKIARRIGYPVVVKVFAPGVTHKSDKGGVILDVRSPTELAKAIKQIDSNFDIPHRYLIQQMIKGKLEVIVGGKRDETFGAIIMFGLGGIWTELIKDVSFRVCPITHADAYQMISDTKGYRFLCGYRGIPRIDQDGLVEIILKISHLLTSNPQLREVDLNPIKFRNGKAVTVDALLIL